jgi:beta-aspartyl-peptidase (threonine type)
VALDQKGNLAAATSTGGLKNSRAGRISDTAVIGAGTWACNGGVAVSCTGTGEQFIRYAVAHEMHSLVKYEKISVQAAADRLVHEVLEKGDGGLIAVDAEGNAAMSFSTRQMWRGVADSDGRYEVMLD